MDYSKCSRAELEALIVELSEKNVQLEHIVQNLRESVAAEHTHRCRACGWAYTPKGSDEDCPVCGHDGK